MSKAKRIASPARVVALYKAGMSLTRIGKRVGYTTSGIARLLNRVGVRKRKLAR